MLVSLPLISLKADEEVYYTNSYGVEFSEKEYNFFTEMMWDGYQEVVTKEDFDKVYEFGLFDSKVEKESIVQVSTPEGYLRGSQLTEKSRTLTITKTCSTYCLMGLTASWNYAPNVKSYDVIGARYDGTSLYQNNNTYVVSSNGTTTVPSSNRQNFTTGFGVSAQLPSTGSNLVVGTTFYVYYVSGATIYGAYEHAMAPVSLSTSKLYYISPYGQGDVLYFTGLAATMYDDCNGVYITL
jgi:hypothetical protein